MPVDTSKMTFVKLDADEGIFFLRQLDVVKSKTYDVQYPQFKARQLFPVSFDAGPGAQTITYYQFDMVGMAKVVSNYATDFPRVDLKGKMFTANVRSLGDSYGYSVQDIRSARQTGMPLEQRKANAAKKAILQTEDSIAVLGDTDNGISGFLSNANVPDVAAPAGASTHTDWARKTPDEILADLNALDESVVDNTNGVEEADTILLPLAQYNLAKTSRLANTDVTVLKFFLENSERIKQVIPWVKLKGAGAGGTDLAVAYKKDPDKLTMEVPQDFEQFPPQEKGMEFEVVCHSRTAGVIIYYPLSISKMHGI